MNQFESVRPVEILLVEDNPDEAVLTFEALQDAKVCNRLHVASDETEAMEFLRRQGAYQAAPRPDLILVDLSLPRAGGPVMLAQVRADPQLQSIPVVALADPHEEESVRHASQAGADCHIAKPVDFRCLAQIVGAIKGLWFVVVSQPPGNGAFTRKHSPA